MEAGGPRFWRERSKETRCRASTCAAAAGCRVTPANIEAEGEGVNVGRTETAGGVTEYGHFCQTMGTDELRDESMLIMQWCLPFLRQHAGTLTAAASAPNSGSVKGSAKSISSEMANMRRTQSLWQMARVGLELHRINRRCNNPGGLARTNPCLRRSARSGESRRSRFFCPE